MDPPKLNLEVKDSVDSTIETRDERIVEKPKPPERKIFLESLNGVMRPLAEI